MATFRVGRSESLLKFMHLAHAMALTACWLTGAPGAAAGLSLGLVISWRWQWLRWRTFSAALRHEDAAWFLTAPGYPETEVTPLGSSVLTQYCLVLHFAGRPAPPALFISRDSLPADDYRRLTVLLKTGKFLRF